MTKLEAAIEETISLLDCSTDSDWSSLTCHEVSEILNKELVKIRKGEEFDKLELGVLFAVTGDIQEISMRNDWHEEYLVIAEKIDHYTEN